VEALIREFLDTLERGAPDPGRLALVGEPEPAQAAQAFARAARHPALAPTRAQWVAALLASARPGFGAAQLESVAEQHAELCGRPLDAGVAPTLARVLGSSNFLARLLLRHPALADDLAGELPAPPDPSRLAPDWSAIRAAKYRGLLRVAARDLQGRPLPEALRELSDLADGCLAAALEAAARETGVEPPALLALGKLGGRELNFSSDVDLLFLYDSPPGAADLARNQEVSQLVRAFKRGLEAPAEDGFGYRVDLDLRPEGPRGVLANSVEAALTYYESFGMEWERQMLIRLRPVAGPEAPATSFSRAIVPFVYRRLIDPGVARAVREMKARIEAERTRAGRDLEADLKEGPGGIRDVEFLVQALQLFYGGREPSIRSGNVLEALERLGGRGLLPESAAADLAEAYTWLRRAEHALQMVEERQTQRFPRDAAGQLALARRLGYREAEAGRARDRLLDDWTAVRAEVRAHFEALVLREET
jgi:glutamate-ammonia-ligase adenylyltransferase